MADYVFWGVQIITTGVIGLMGYFLKGIKKDITDSILKNDARVTKLEEEVHRMPGKYVLKEDYQLNIRNIDSKFDRVDEKLDRITKILMDGRSVK